jgi:hypothetical protein
MMLLLGLGILGVSIEVGQKVRGLGDEKTRALLLGPFGFYIASCLWGVIIGGLLGAVSHLVRRARSRGTSIEPAEGESGASESTIPNPGPGA